MQQPSSSEQQRAAASSSEQQPQQHGGTAAAAAATVIARAYRMTNTSPASFVFSHQCRKYIQLARVCSAAVPLQRCSSRAAPSLFAAHSVLSGRRRPALRLLWPPATRFSYGRDRRLGLRRVAEFHVEVFADVAAVSFGQVAESLSRLADDDGRFALAILHRRWQVARSLTGRAVSLPYRLAVAN